MSKTTDAGVGPPAPNDDELARLAQEGGPPSEAMRALYERLSALIRRFIARHVWLRALPAAEAEDATQEMALAFLQAVSHFDPDESGDGAGDRFPVFLRRVLRDCLSNYERRLHRRERRLDRSKDAAQELDERARQGEKDPSGGPAGDPAALVLWEEDCRRLEEALGQLGDEYRRLWDGLASGSSLEALAKEERLSNGQLKRRRRRLLATLRDVVAADPSQPPRNGGQPRLWRAAPMKSSADAFKAASELLQAGRRGEAANALRALLVADPRHAPAPYLLGLMAYEEGRAADAAAWFAHAVHVEPAVALYHSCLGAALQAGGRPAEAEPAHRRALALKPGDGAILNNLGITLTALGKHAEAEDALRGASAVEPNDAAAWCNLGAALHAQGKLDEAEAACRQALAFAPGLAQAHTNLGNVLGDRRRPEEAEACHRQAIELQPRLTEAWRNLGGLLRGRGRLAEATQALQRALRLSPGDAAARVQLAEALLDHNRPADAIALCREALRLRPHDADGHNAVGNALAALGLLDDAGLAYREAARLRPDWSSPVYNRGVALQGQGRLAEARAAFEQALRVNPGDHVAHATRVGSLLFDPDMDGERLLAESRHWAEGHAAAPAPAASHPNAPDPSRRLRVGYVSPDFRCHAVAFFLGPVLACHDPDAVEVFCYADVAAPDDTTARLHGLVRHWRMTWGLSDDELEALVRQDGVDVLVDLCGHLAHNRLRVFARKPAPVQLTWLGYPATTGVPGVDYRLTDAVCDPPAEPACATEELVRLPGPFCCYEAPLHVGQRSDPPSAPGQGVVFGSLHKLEKLNDRVVDLWAHLLCEVPDSGLLLCRNTLQGATADFWREQFTRRGLAADRVELRPVVPVGLRHLRVYDGIDVALDAFPWSGHTTACEALWMGVPVVTLRGRLCHGRMVASVLEAVGLNELIAETPEDYRRIAADLARDAARRKELRQTLRLRMLRSPLCDRAGFTHGLEDAYRTMWRAWCKKQDRSGS